MLLSSLANTDTLEFPASSDKAILMAHIPLSASGHYHHDHYINSGSWLGGSDHCLGMGWVLVIGW